MSSLRIPAQTHADNLPMPFAAHAMRQQPTTLSRDTELSHLVSEPSWLGDHHPRPRVHPNAALASMTSFDMHTLRECFQSGGVHLHRPVAEAMILHRLNAVHLSVNHFLNAIRIAQSPAHPLWKQLKANPVQVHLVLRDLAAVTTKNGWKILKRQAIIKASNNPQLLCAALWKNLLR